MPLLRGHAANAIEVISPLFRNGGIFALIPPVLVGADDMIIYFVSGLAQ